MIELAMLSLLENTAGLSAAPVLGRVHVGKLPEKCQYPAVVFRRITSPSAERRSDKTQHSTRRSLLQVDVWSSTYLEAGTIGAAVESALDGFSGTVSGIAIGLVEVEDNQPIFDESSELCRATLEIAIYHRQ